MEAALAPRMGVPAFSWEGVGVIDSNSVSNSARGSESEISTKVMEQETTGS